MNKYRSQSVYCYPNTDILINKFDERDPEKLENLEITYTTRRIYELYKKPIPGSFGLKHLQKIHKYIFQDIYPFAGELREEKIQKGTTPFAHPLHIATYGSEIFKKLKNEKFLKGLDKESFINRVSYYLAEVNMLHPFREGNGRTQREFFRLLSMKNGYELDWSKVSPKEMINASIKSVVESAAFTNLLNKAIVNDEPDNKLIKQYTNILKKDELEL